MCGQDYMYNGKIVTVLEANKEEDMIRLKTSSGPLLLKPEEMRVFVPAPTLDMTTVNHNMKIEMADCKSLADIMKDVIQRTIKSPDFVPQAKEINSSINNLINLKRAQIDIVRLAMQFK